MTQEDPVWKNKKEVQERLKQMILDDMKREQRKQLLLGALISIAVISLTFGVAWVLDL